MPVNKNAMTRYKILDELLSSRYHNYSLDELTEEVSNRLVDMYPGTKGVVRRTIEKDIYYLEYEGPFMVEIERYSVPSYNKEKRRTYNKQCLRYAHPSFSIFKKVMSDEEKYLLKEALSMLGQFDGLPNFDTLESLRLGLGVKRNNRKIISLTKNPLENSSLLAELFTAISQQQVIELHYHRFDAKQNVFAVNLYPYLLKEYNRRWFLIASAEEDNKFLCFSLDRIDKVVPLPSHRYVSYEGDIHEMFEDIIGVTINERSPIFEILFWVSDVSKDYVATKPIHESQRHVSGSVGEQLRDKYPMLHSGAFFRIDCKENYELIRELTSFGKELIVLSPVEIRQKVMDRFFDSAKAYQNIFLQDI